jgi:hypothetical protein
MKRITLILIITTILTLTLIQYNYSIQSIIKLEDNFNTLNTNYWKVLKQENSVIAVIQDSRCVDNYCLLIDTSNGITTLYTNYMKEAYLNNILVRYIDITLSKNTKLLCVNMSNTYVCLELKYESTTIGFNTYVTTTLLLNVVGTTYPLANVTYIEESPYGYLLSTYPSFKELNIILTFYENELSVFLTYVDANLMDGSASRTVSFINEQCENISIVGEGVMYMIDYIVVNGYLTPREETTPSPTIPIPTTPPTTNTTPTPTTTPTTTITNVVNMNFILLLILIMLSLVIMSRKRKTTSF